MPTVPKGQKVGGCGGHADLAARALHLLLVYETERCEGGWVGVVGFVEVDGMKGDGDVGTIGKVGSVGKGEGFTDNTGHGYCREK